MLAASEISCNASGKKVMLEKVVGSTMAKARQPKFITSVVSTMRDTVVETHSGPKEVSMFTTRSDEIFPGIIRITKGLLAAFHSNYDYQHDAFNVVDIHSATLLKKDRDLQLHIVHELKTKTRGDGRGNHGEFKFWRQIESKRGVWLLVFYEAMHFVVLHEHPGARVPESGRC
jgi:hypothetical protein